MDTTAFVFDLLKILLPAILVFCAAFFTLRSYLANEQRKGLLKLQIANKQTTLPIRLQACERMLLYIERITPSNLSVRLYQTGMTARDLQLEMVQNIRTEFEHNLAQQLYLPKEVWISLRGAKDFTIQAINKSTASLSGSATGIDLSKAIMQEIDEWEINYHEYAIDQLRKEAQKLF